MEQQHKHYQVRVHVKIERRVRSCCLRSEIVPQLIQEEMQTIYVSLSELLRHFWSSFPPSSPQIEEKVNYSTFIVQHTNVDHDDDDYICMFDIVLYMIF
jgi:hypothetical protein